MNSFNIYFDICALIITISSIFIVAMKHDIRKLQNRIFIVVVLNEFLTEITDIVSSVLISNASQSNIILALIFSYFYYFFHILLTSLLMSYVLATIGIMKRHEKRFFLFLLIPCAVSILGLMLNPIFNWIFYFDSQFNYHHGLFLYIIYASSAFYIGTMFFYIIRYRTAIPNSKEIYLISFIGAATLSVVFQTIFPHLLVELFMEAAMTLCLLVTIENNGEMYNTVTSVYNRRVFLFENLSSLKNNIKYKVIIVKLLNERYYMSVFGYLFMQNVMYDVARFLVSITNESSVYDCENGNFAIILYGVSKEKSELIVKQISEKFSQDWIQKEISIGFEIQICLINIPENINSLENLISLIDSNDVKLQSRVSIVQQDQLKFLQRKSAVENAIEKALQNNGFKVFYQPIWDCHSNKIHSAEALVRLIDDELGFIPPDEFIPIAEKNGTITAIGQFVFEETCRMFSKKNLNEIGLKFIEVNLSTVQCMHKSLPDVLKNTLEQYGLGTKTINLEITESAAINSQETFQKTIHNLRNLGFTFSLDDYGTGYSNASYIFNMDFEIIKIDKSILWESEKKASAKIILQNTVRMIKEMKMKILVEGVETEKQKQMVASLGCDYCQGYYFSKPVSQDEFIEYTKKFNAASNLLSSPKSSGYSV